MDFEAYLVSIFYRHVESLDSLNFFSWLPYSMDLYSLKINFMSGSLT
jgi:hypothetical protein